MCLNCTLKSLLVCYFRDENFFWICPFMLFPTNFHNHEKLEWPLLLEYRFKLSDKVLQFWCERISFFRVLSQLVTISFLIEFFNAKYKWKTVIDKCLQRAPLLSLLFDIHRIIFTISTLINILLSSRNSVSLLLQKENNTKKYQTIIINLNIYIILMYVVIYVMCSCENQYKKKSSKSPAYKQ